MRLLSGWTVVCAVSTALLPLACKSTGGASGLRGAEDAAPVTDQTDPGANALQIQNCKTLAANYPKTVELTPGQTYLRFMKDKVKPMLDDVATNGYDLTDGKGVEAAYACSVEKVRQKVDKVGIDKFKTTIEGITARHVNMNTVAKAIQDSGAQIDAFDAANFFGFASGGGVLVKYTNANYALNVHYDVKNLQSGRSYGVGPAKGANDASDREYLDETEAYTRRSPDNLSAFYGTIFNGLLNGDASGFAQVNDEGQGVLSDFFAIYTAEEDRNLMQNGSIKPYWDAALLEVTLLASFHGGQSKFGLYYFDLHTKKTAFVTQTWKQTSCKLSTKTKPASLNDYWQFSRQWASGSTASCTRSGINLTKSEFRKLGTQVTQWMRANQPDAFNRVVTAMGLAPAQVNNNLNLYFELSKALMSNKGLEPIANAQEYASAWVDFVGLTQTKANDISTWFQGGTGTPDAAATPVANVDPNETVTPPIAQPAMATPGEGQATQVVLPAANAMPAIPAVQVTPDPVDGHTADTQAAGG